MPLRNLKFKARKDKNTEKEVRYDEEDSFSQ
jgi:hypothetical protein